MSTTEQKQIPALLPLHSLNHVSRETRDCRRLQDFYTRVLGFRQIERPVFGFDGAWLAMPNGYARQAFDPEGHPAAGSIVLHIIEKDESTSLPEGPSSVLPPATSSASGIHPSSYPDKPIAIRRGHHLAFRTEDIESVQLRLREWGIPFEMVNLPGSSTVQLFFFDPDGNGIEIGNFSYYQSALIDRDRLTTSMPRPIPALPDAIYPLEPLEPLPHLANLRVGIVGGSIAGLSAALALHRVGVKVEVYERSARERRRTGGGIGVHDDTRECLKAMGFSAQELRQLMLPMRIQEDRGRDGRVIRRGVIPFWSAHWWNLYDLLLGALPEVVQFGRHVVEPREDDAGVTVVFKDKDKERRMDVLVGADGICSVVREAAFGSAEKLRHAGYFAWRGQVAMEDMDPKAAELVEREFPRNQFYLQMSGRQHAVVYYLSHGSRGVCNWLLYRPNSPEAKTEYRFREQVTQSITADATEEEIRDLKETIDKHFTPAVVNLIRATPEPFKNEIYDRDPIDKFSSGRIVIIGDAAHPTTPHFIRGSNMALQDGYWLARTLSELPSDVLGSSDFIQRWFAAFNERRVRETRSIVLTSRHLGRVKQGLIQDLQAEDWDLMMEGDEFAALAKDGIEAA